VCIIDWFFRPDEVDVDAAEVRPRVEVIRRELRAAVDLNSPRRTALRDHLVKLLGHRSRGQAASDLQRQAFSNEAVGRGQDLDLSAVRERVGDEVHAPAIVDLSGRGRTNSRMAGELLAAFHAHGEPLLTIQAVGPLRIPVPALPTQQDRQASIAITQSRQGQIAQPHAQRSLVFRSTLVSMSAARPAGHAEGSALTHTELGSEIPGLLAALDWR
jgi:hypothetical protein